MIIKGFRVYGPLVIQRIEEPIYIWYEEAEDCLHARVSGAATSGNAVRSATSSKDLGAEKTVKFLGGVVNGCVVGCDIRDQSSGGYGYATGLATAYVECRRADNVTVVAKFSLPLFRPLIVKNVRYIYLTVSIPISVKRADSGRVAYVADASVFWKILE